MAAILNQKWPPKYKKTLIWGTFCFQLDFVLVNACLTHCKYPFLLKSFHLKILNNLFLFFFYFYIGGHFENFKNKEHNFE
jgi:hypothetical protein